MGIKITIEIEGGDDNGKVIGVVSLDEDALKNKPWPVIMDEVRGLCVQACRFVFYDPSEDR